MRVDWQTRLMVLSLAAVTLAWSGYTRARWGFVRVCIGPRVETCFYHAFVFCFFLHKTPLFSGLELLAAVRKRFVWFFLHVTHARTTFRRGASCPGACQRARLRIVQTQPEIDNQVVAHPEKNLQSLVITAL